MRFSFELPESKERARVVNLMREILFKRDEYFIIPSLDVFKNITLK
jgi:hypothetical protein